MYKNVSKFFGRNRSFAKFLTGAGAKVLKNIKAKKIRYSQLIVKCEYCQKELRYGKYNRHVRKVHVNIPKQPVNAGNSANLSESRNHKAAKNEARSNIKVKVFTPNSDENNEQFNGVKIIPLKTDRDD
jgi:hypothetical protein